MGLCKEQHIFHFKNLYGANRLVKKCLQQKDIRIPVIFKHLKDRTTAVVSGLAYGRLILLELSCSLLKG